MTRPCTGHLLGVRGSIGNRNLFGRSARAVVPLPCKVLGLIEIQDCWIAFADDCRPLALLSNVVARDTADRSFIGP